MRERKWKRKWCIERRGRKKREGRVKELGDKKDSWGEAGSVSV